MCKCSLLRATAADQVNNKRDVRYRHDGCKQRAATSERIVQILCEVRNQSQLPFMEHSCVCDCLGGGVWITDQP